MPKQAFISSQPLRRPSSGVSAVPSGGGLTFLMQEVEDEDDEDVDNPAKFVTQVRMKKVQCCGKAFILRLYSDTEEFGYSDTLENGQKVSL